MAQDSRQGLAPADEYFGHYHLSVLGISNAIRDAGTRVDSNADAHSLLDGPLSYVADAMKDWEQKYPSDPWIAKDLVALESVYLRVPTDEGFRLASQTETWLVADYGNTEYATQGREQLALNRIPYMPQQEPNAQYAQQPVQQPAREAQPPVQYVQQTVQYVQQPVQYVQQPVAYVQQPVAYVQQPVAYALPSYATPWTGYAPMRFRQIQRGW